MTTQAKAVQQVQVTATGAIAGQSMAALIFGSLVLFAVGFLPMDVAHNAAHDTRHALVFPCH